MAIFTVGKRMDESKETYDTIYYPQIEDFIRLVHYCYDKCVWWDYHLLYRLGIDSMIDQMLYLQNFTGKKLNTRAIHYILSVEYDELRQKDKHEEAKDICRWLNAWCLREHQHMTFLHHDKWGRYDIHIIANPINYYTLNKYHCSKNELNNMIREIAEVLYYEAVIAIQGYSYITKGGRLKFGKVDDIYQNI